MLLDRQRDNPNQIHGYLKGKETLIQAKMPVIHGYSKAEHRCSSSWLFDRLENNYLKVNTIFIAFQLFRKIKASFTS